MAPLCHLCDAEVAEEPCPVCVTELVCAKCAIDPDTAVLCNRACEVCMDDATRQDEESPDAEFVSMHPHFAPRTCAKCDRRMCPSHICSAAPTLCLFCAESKRCCVCKALDDRVDRPPCSLCPDDHVRCAGCPEIGCVDACVVCVADATDWDEEEDDDEAGGFVTRGTAKCVKCKGKVCDAHRSGRSRILCRLCNGKDADDSASDVDESSPRFVDLTAGDDDDEEETSDPSDSSSDDDDDEKQTPPPRARKRGRPPSAAFRQHMRDVKRFNRGDANGVRSPIVKAFLRQQTQRATSPVGTGVGSSPPAPPPPLEDPNTSTG